MISVEVSDTELFEIEQRFAVFFNGQGNNYIGALNYFHKLKQEQQRHLREHTVHGPKLDKAIDEVMFGTYQSPDKII